MNEQAQTSYTVSPGAYRQGVQTPAEATRGGPTYRPEVDIIETPSEILLVADIPGAEPENIQVDFERGTLVVSASIADRAAGPSQAQASHLLREYAVGNYKRVFQVSETVDSTKIEAEYHDGVLFLHLPKVDAAKPRKIQVKTA